MGKRISTNAMEPESSILLLNSDKAFNETMTDVATNLHVALATLKNVGEAVSENLLPFGVIIVDWDAGAGRALAAIRTLEKKFGPHPVLLIGEGDDELLQDVWPKSVKGFIPKERGFRAILDSAMALSRLEL